MTDGTVDNPVECIDWSEAFDACRERDRPIIVLVDEPGGEYENPDGPGYVTHPDERVLARVFPSGRCEELKRSKMD